MAGTLLHARAFEIDRYTGDDGNQHYELVPRDGDGDVMSNSSWRETVAYFESMGIPQQVWPTYGCNIDLPLSEIVSQNEALRERVNDVAPAAQHPPWAERLLHMVRSGEMLFYCME